MWQIIAKIMFIVLILGTYILGQYLTPYLAEFGVNIDAKILLPIISFVFHDDWLRLFNKFAVSMEINKETHENGFKIFIDVIYSGKDTINMSLKRLYGINDVNAELIYSYPNKAPVPCSPPEVFATHLNPIQPSVNIIIDLAFRRKIEPRLTIPFKKLDVYFLVLIFKIGNRKKRKFIMLTRKRNLYAQRS